MYQVLLYRSKTGTCTVFCTGSAHTCNTVLYSSTMRDYFLGLGYTNWEFACAPRQAP